MLKKRAEILAFICIIAYSLIFGSNSLFANEVSEYDADSENQYTHTNTFNEDTSDINFKIPSVFTLKQPVRSKDNIQPNSNIKAPAEYTGDTDSSQVEYTQNIGSHQVEYIKTDAKRIPVVDGRSFQVFTYSMEKATQYVKAMDKLAGKLGIPTYVIISPAASDLYLPDEHRNPKNSIKPAFDMLDKSFKHAVFINLFDIFHSAKDDYIFYRSDHHWTAEGAYIAYENFGKIAGFTPVAKENMRKGTAQNFLGSLYRAVSSYPGSDIFKRNLDYVDYYYPVYDTTLVHYSYVHPNLVNPVNGNVINLNYSAADNKYKIFLGGDTVFLHIKSAVANGKSIFVIKDSYGNAFLPYIANNYEDIFAIDPRGVTYFPLESFLKEHSIDEVLWIGYPHLSLGTGSVGGASELNKFEDYVPIIEWQDLDI